jgi:hypothetical protein
VIVEAGVTRVCTYAARRDAYEQLSRIRWIAFTPLADDFSQCKASFAQNELIVLTPIVSLASSQNML